MNRNYYKEACMCRNPVPSRIIPQRCAWCGGILPPSVRLMYHLERELDEMPSGGAILAVVLVAVALAVMVAIGHITLTAIRHDPNPPAFAQEILNEESPAPGSVATGD